MWVMLVSCTTLWVAVYWLMQGSKDCTVFSLLRLESPQIESSLLWSNCITSHSVNGINNGLPLKDCRLELTSDQVRVTVQYTYHLNKVLDYNCTHDTEVNGFDLTCAHCGRICVDTCVRKLMCVYVGEMRFSSREEGGELVQMKHWILCKNRHTGKYAGSSRHIIPSIYFFNTCSFLEPMPAYTG